MSENAQPTSWFDEIWPRVVVASGVGYLAATYGISRWLTRRSSARVEAPTMPNCTVELIACQTKDRLNLRGWCLEPKRPRATIALFHGMRLNRMHMLDRVQILLAAGYRCVAFDHRAHGESDGRVCSFGFHERHDVAAVLDWIRRRWPDERCGAVATSMGAAAVCFAADVARGFDAVVLESVYTELARAFNDRIGCGYPAWFRHFRSGVVWITERRLGAPIQEVAPLAHIARLAPTPILLLTGSEDPHAPPHEGVRLAARIATHCRFCVVPGAGHADVCVCGGSLYRDLLTKFLDEHLFGTHIAEAA